MGGGREYLEQALTKDKEYKGGSDASKEERECPVFIDHLLLPSNSLEV